MSVCAYSLVTERKVYNFIGRLHWQLHCNFIAYATITGVVLETSWLSPIHNLLSVFLTGCRMTIKYRHRCFLDVDIDAKPGNACWLVYTEYSLEEYADTQY